MIIVETRFFHSVLPKLK